MIPTSDSSDKPQNYLIKTLLLSSLFFFLPAAANYPGRAYYYLANLQNYAEISFNDIFIINLVLLPSIIIGIFMLAYRIISQEQIFNNISYFSLLTLMSVLLLTLAGTASTIANHNTPGVITNYFSGILSTAVLSFAFVNLRINTKSINFIFLTFLLGCMFPLILGLYAYYQDWKIPNLVDLIFSHFNLKKMHEYEIQTFGNSDNTAVFMGMAGVLFYGCLLNDNSRTWRNRIIYGLGFGLVILHLIILEIRSCFFCFFGITLIMSFIYKRKIFWGYLIIIFGIFVLLYFIVPNIFGIFMQRMMLAMMWTNADSSQSAAERLDAMRIGWDLFKQNYYLGVGPGASMHYISYGSAHQFNIQQGAELGFIGFFASICLCVLGVGRFIQQTIRYYKTRIGYEKIILTSVPAFYFLDSIIANTPISAGIINTWISLTIVMLLLSDFN